MDVFAEYAGRGIEFLRGWLSAGGNPGVTDVLGTPLLCVAAARGDVEAVRLLVERGVDVEVSGDDGWTPLIHAASSESEVVVEYLVRAGANVGAVTVEGYRAVDRVPLRNEALRRRLSVPG